MSLYNKIFEDYKNAMKNKEVTKKEILNYLFSLCKNKKIDLQRDLNDDEVIAIIKKEIKTREESISYLEKNSLEESNIEKEKIWYLQYYLPTMLSKEQLKNIVFNTIKELNIQEPWKQRWVIIWAIMKDYKTVIDSKILNEIFNELL